MKKRNSPRIALVSCMLILAFTVTSNAQVHFTVNTNVACNPAAINLLYQIHKAAPDGDIELLYKKIYANNKLIENYPFLLKNEIVYARAIVEPNEGYNTSMFTSLGILIRRDYGKFITADIPLGSLSSLLQSDMVKGLKVDLNGRTFMEMAREQCGVNMVHAGENLPLPVMGEGVLIGIPDSGFDYTSPAFRDASGNMRIKKAWIMWDESGSSENEFGYGLELTDSISLMARQHDFPGHHHGTGVAAVAASSGLGTPDFDYRGMAPASDLIFVSMDENNWGESMGLDACSYIHDYAIEQGMPCVINSSWGFDDSALDGTAYLDQYIDNMAYSHGFVMVNAPGNEGGLLQHISHNFSGDTIRSIIDPNFEFPSTMFLWGQVGAEYSVSFGLVDVNGNVQEETEFVTSNVNGVQLLSFESNNASLNAEVAVASQYPTNGRPNMQISLSFNASPQNEPALHPYITITAPNGTVYTKSLFANFTNYVPQSGTILEGFTMGDDQMCIAGTPGTSFTTIAAGAYNNQDSYISAENEEIPSEYHSPAGDHTFYSVKGYSEDGRVKPEITAPTCISQINSFSTLDEGLPSESFVDYITFEGRTYPIEGCQNGTSTSSPAAAGIVALILSANPQISIEELREVVTSTARTDEWTGTDLPNSTWGYGKINAYGAVQQALILANIEKPEEQRTHWKAFPNPTVNTLNLMPTGHSDQNSLISIFDLNGKLVLQHKPNGSANISIDVSSLKQGLYVVSITSQGAISNLRFTKLY